MKKLILPIIFAFVTILFFSFLMPRPIFAFLGIGESSSEFDCQKFWEGLSDDEGLTIGGPRKGSISNVSDWKFSSKKKTMGKTSGDACDIGGIRYDDDIEGEAKTGFEINISYFPNQEEAKEQVSILKAAESVQVEDQNISGDTYSMRTVKLTSVDERPNHLAAGNFGRTVGKLGNCVVTLTHTWYALAWQNTLDVYENQAAQMDEVMGMTQEGWRALSETKDLQQFCGGKASTSSSSNQKIQQVNPQKPQSNQAQPEDKVNLFTQALGGFPVTIGEWFKAVSTGWGMQEFFYQNELFADEVLFGRDRREIAEEEAAEQEKGNLQFQQNRKEILDKQGLADLDEVFNRIPIIKDTPDYKIGELQQDSPFRLDLLEGQVQIKYPGESEWRDIKVGDKIPEGSTIFTGMDTTTVLSIKDKGVVQILPFTEVTLSEEGLSQPGKTTTEIDLKTGEIELNVQGGVYTAGDSPMEVNAPLATISIRGTHFWVRHDDENKTDTIGVYEGTVDVKTKGNNKSVLASPNGDKPGVVVVAQKLSTTKLAIGGLILILIVVGGVLVIKKKLTPKGSGKRKRN